MKSDYQEYKETGMLGGYDPAIAVLRQHEGGVNTIFRDSAYFRQNKQIIGQRSMQIGDRVFHVTSVFPGAALATPTDKLLSLIDVELGKQTR